MIEVSEGQLGKSNPGAACLWNVIEITMMNPLQETVMKTVQVTLDETLVSAVDKAARKLKISRSAFTREALARL